VSSRSLEPTPDLAEKGAAKVRGRRRIISWSRVVSCLAAGLLAALVVAVLGLGELSALVGWAVAAVGLLTWVWRISWPQDHRGTKRLAEEEGRTHATDTVVLAAAVASLAAVFVAVVQAGGRDAVDVASVVLSVGVVILSWALVNTVFALKYARLYYAGGDGGIDFHQDAPPMYSDFAYVAFCVGMTFAVAETEPADPDIRKATLGHGLLSYLFTTVLVAVAVNLLTSIGKG
jgi:uncharacterized membrane protein